MNATILVLILIAFFRSCCITCISIQNSDPAGQSTLERHADIINAGYAQCKSSNEVCSTNNDCCSTCCTSFTYSAMTCQDTCPETENVQNKADQTHGNVVWKSKYGDDEGTINVEKLLRNEDREKVTTRHQRENRQNDTKSDNTMRGISDMSPFAVKDDKKEYTNDKNKQILELGKFIITRVETKPNKDVGIRINDDSSDDSSENVTKGRENVEVGLSVIDINKGGKGDDSGENQNTDIGTPIIKIGEKAKDDDSEENQNTDIGTPIIKIGEKTKEKLGKKVNELNENFKHAHSKEGNNRDLGGDVITIQTIKTDKTKTKDQNFNKIKLENKTSLESKANFTGEDLKVLNMSSNTNKGHKKTRPTNSKMNNTSVENTMSTICPGGDKTCESGQSLADNIKDILTQKLPNLMSLNPTQQAETPRKPVCKTIGSTCKHPGQCCSQCCAVSDGVFKCFDKGTDECQSSLPGATAPKCKKPGDHCETHGECCLKRCTDCGHFSACDNESGNVCRLEGKSVVDTKLCKHLGDTCGEASECCTQCCAVSDGMFKCFEEGTHECQPGDNVSNTTVSELVEAVGFAN